MILCGRYDASGFNEPEIYLYEASTGNIIQLTDNTIYEYNPKISDTGDIVWKMDGYYILRL